MNNSKLNQLISLIKLNISRNKLIIRAPYSRLNIDILKILYYEGYIRGFKVSEKEYQIYIYAKFNEEKSIFKDIVYFNSKNKNNYISYKKLINSFGLKNFAIISTDIVY